jgi:hypothetical protein
VARAAAAAPGLKLLRTKVTLTLLLWRWLVCLATWIETAQRGLCSAIRLRGAGSCLATWIETYGPDVQKQYCSGLDEQVLSAMFILFRQDCCGLLKIFVPFSQREWIDWMRKKQYCSGLDESKSVLGIVQIYFTGFFAWLLFIQFRIVLFDPQQSCLCAAVSGEQQVTRTLPVGGAPTAMGRPTPEGVREEYARFSPGRVLTIEG